jgi:hypothetical protein
MARWDANRRFVFSLQLAPGGLERCADLNYTPLREEKMAKIIALEVLLVLVGCANNQRVVRYDTLKEHGDPSHPLYVGHSDTGDVVVAASHFDAMSGLAVAAVDVGGKGQEQLLCARQMLTGTHVAKWICRYQSEIDAERMETQNYLVGPRNSVGRGNLKSNFVTVISLVALPAQ